MTPQQVSLFSRWRSAAVHRAEKRAKALLLDRRLDLMGMRYGRRFLFGNEPVNP
jgi:hypothetical protein